MKSFIKGYDDPYELIAETNICPELCLAGLAELLDFNYESKMDVFLENHHSIIESYTGDLDAESREQARLVALYNTLYPISGRIESKYKRLEKSMSK